MNLLPTWTLILLCFIYCISPIDLLPFIPIDDVAVFGWTVFTIFKRLSTASRNSVAKTDGGSAMGTPTATET